MLETKPGNAIRIIDCDLQVDFAPPVGYEESKKSGRNAVEDFQKPIVVDDRKDKRLELFSGIGYRVDGKPIKTLLPTVKPKDDVERGFPDRK